MALALASSIVYVYSCVCFTLGDASIMLLDIGAMALVLASVAMGFSSGAIALASCMALCFLYYANIKVAKH
jgi:hypothetical protein